MNAYNSTISAITGSNTRVFKLSSFIQGIRETGIQVGPYQIGGRYLEGFYSQDGLFPSSTGQALIANELLDLLNSSYNSGFQKVDVEEVARRDDNVSKGQSNNLRGTGRFRPPIVLERPTRSIRGEGRLDR